MNTLVKTFAPVKRVNTFPTFFDTFFNELESVAPRANFHTFPAVNILEDDAAFSIELAAPGLSKEAFNVSVHEGVLVISTEKKEENTEKTEKFTRKEFSYSSFKRSFTLPKTVNAEAIEASYVDGILKLVVPKKEEAKPKEPLTIAVA